MSSRTDAFGRPVVSNTSGSSSYTLDKPTNIPLERADTTPATFARSYDYKIEDIEGQSTVRDWFKNDIGAANSVDLHAKVTSGNTGRAKVKVTVDPTDKANVKVTEEIEIQANIHASTSALFKVKAKELTAHVDLGNTPVSGFWFNPSLGLKLPRTGGSVKSSGIFSLGGVFHYDTAIRRRFRHRIELGLGFGSTAPQKNDLSVINNLSFWYDNFIFSVYNNLNLNNTQAGETKLSAVYSDRLARAYVQAEVAGPFRFAGFGLGASYKVRPDVTLFVQTQQPLGKDATPFSFQKLDLGVGAGYTHAPTGLGVKLAYFHEKKIATAWTYNLNRYFTGSLLLDVS